MPILKQLVSGANAKRRSRMDLTREMISAPLGDFRHTMHVGRSGDAFGDTSFLATRSGEPPESASYPSSPRPSLLSRTFRSSKRSQSVTRVDQQLLTPSGSAPYVKNAMSLPFLGDGDAAAASLTASLTSSPCKTHELDELDGGGGGARFLELQERSFGELTELPESSNHVHHHGGGMKHAESVMSFHVDLGPSMLGDILGVMEKEDDDLGYEEGKSSEGHAEEEEEEKEEEEEEEGAAKMAELQLRGGSARPPATPAQPGREEEEEEEEEELGPARRPQLLDDSCSVSSCGSAPPPPDDKLAGGQTYVGDTDSATFSAPPPEEEEEEREEEQQQQEEEEEESHFSSFLEDEDDEIRV
ncbi:cdc42 effector protein 4a [Nelusetta ayraudi]|uniref:cdc42 effector protein 4a n=1 Tax=Nelusetta ayraudi TaxID=303726 RepID=UPI003F6FB07B